MPPAVDPNPPPTNIETLKIPKEVCPISCGGMVAKPAVVWAEIAIHKACSPRSVGSRILSRDMLEKSNAVTRKIIPMRNKNCPSPKIWPQSENCRR